MERVWRHIQEDSSDEDIGRAGKAKKEKVPKEVHQCEGCNASGTRCKNPAVEKFSEQWLCFRHFPEDESESEEEPEPEPVPVVVPQKKKGFAPKK